MFELCVCKLCCNDCVIIVCHDGDGGNKGALGDVGDDGSHGNDDDDYDYDDNDDDAFKVSFAPRLELLPSLKLNAIDRHIDRVQMNARSRPIHGTECNLNVNYRKGYAIYMKHHRTYHKVTTNDGYWARMSNS